MLALVEAATAAAAAADDDGSKISRAARARATRIFERAPAQVPIGSAPAPTTVEYAEAVVRLMCRPAGGVPMGDIVRMPLPLGVTSPSAISEMRSLAMTLVSRRFVRHESNALHFLAFRHVRPTDAIMQSLVYVLQCSDAAHRQHPAIVAFMAAPTVEQCDAVRHVFQSDQRWMSAYDTMRTYVESGARDLPARVVAMPGEDEAARRAREQAEEAEIALDGRATHTTVTSAMQHEQLQEKKRQVATGVVAAWRVTRFDQRTPTSVALAQRRACMRILARYRVGFREVATRPGHPNASDVRIYFNYLAHFGNDDQMVRRLTFQWARDYAELVQALHRDVPGWVHRRLDGRPVERFDEQRMSSQLVSAAAGSVDHNAMMAYLVHTLDTNADRVAALTSLLGTYRITPLVVYAAIAADSRIHADFVSKQFGQFIHAAWLPRMAPVDRPALVRSARELQPRVPDDIATAFIVNAMPDLVDWPCDADVAFLLEMITLVKSDLHRRFIINKALTSCTPEGTQYMTAAQTQQFVVPLLRTVSDEQLRGSIVGIIIDTWRRSMPEPVASVFVSTTPNEPYRSMMDRTLAQHRDSVAHMGLRIRVLRKRLDARGRNQDQAARADTPAEQVCTTCRTNLRRVCYVPCGHVVACVRCAVAPDTPCTACQTVVLRVQPFTLPIA